LLLTKQKRTTGGPDVEYNQLLHWLFGYGNPMAVGVAAIGMV
jgi:hypothetical protein